MMQPRHTIASNRPDSAAARAACGISNAPGTENCCTCPSVAPASLSAATAASRRLSVTCSLKRDTMTAKRNGDASPSVPGAWSCPRNLTSFEFGFALFEKRLRALAHVLGARDQAEERRLEDLRLRERHLETFMDGFEDVADRDRRLARKRGRQLLRLAHQVGGWDHVVDQPQPMRVLCRNLIAGEQQFERAAASNDARETLRA